MNKINIYFIIGALVIALAFSGCNSGSTAEVSQSEPAARSTASVLESGTASGAEIEAPSGAETEQDAGQSYIYRVVQETADKLTQPGMSEYEMAKAAFDYMIESTNLAEPVGLELWRIRGKSDARPTFVENRSLSVLLYGVGMCEDYAAALTMLLRGMGLEAGYVPGLTYAANGSGLVDHAWTVAKIDGVWYHLDCQLEDNITRRNTVRYKYFMRSDATMSGSHRWGENLIDSRLLTAEQNEEIARDFLLEPCPKDYPTPPPSTFTPAAMPDVDAIKTAIDTELREYENGHGALPPLELDIIPPVFGLDGFGPPD